MRKLLVVLAVMLLAIPVMAQEEACDIDLSEVETLLSEAQEAVDAGDTSAALDLIGEMQAALETITDGCITLGQTFEAPDDSFSFSYPDDWVFGEYDSEGSDLAIVFVGSSANAIEEAGGNEPSLRSGEQLVGLFFGTLSTFTGGEAPETLESVIESMIGDIKDEYPNISSVEYFTNNDHRAGRFEFSGDTFAASFTVIEYRAGERYMMVIGIAAPDEMDTLRPIVDAIALSIRVEGRL